MPRHNGFSQEEVSETVAQFMLGESLEKHGLHLDAFGDIVKSVSNISGVMFRERHYKVKKMLNRLCMTSTFNLGRRFLG